MFFLPAAQFAYREGLGCADTLLTISHHLQKSLDTGMESYIVQLDFSAAFDRVSLSGLLFKLKSIAVGGSVLSIWREILSNRRQRVVVDGAASEWIPIVSDVPQRMYWVLFYSPFKPVKCLSRWITTICLCWWLHITGRCTQASRRTGPTVAASLTRDLANIQEWCNTGAWYWILAKLRL